MKKIKFNSLEDLKKEGKSFYWGSFFLPRNLRNNVATLYSICRYFDDIADKKEFKNKYREALDTITTDSSVINAIVTEANYAFRLNMYMFDEIKSTDPYPAMTAIKGFWKFLLGTINK